HDGHSIRSTVALELANVAGPKEELSVQITLFNRVHIGDIDLALRSGCKTNHGPVLQHLATNGASTDKELFDISNLLLELLAKDCNLSIISAANGLAAFLCPLDGGGQTFQRVKVQVLNDRVELSRYSFQHFLCSKTSENCGK